MYVCACRVWPPSPPFTFNAPSDAHHGLLSLCATTIRAKLVSDRVVRPSVGLRLRNVEAPHGAQRVDLASLLRRAAAELGELERQLQHGHLRAAHPFDVAAELAEEEDAALLGEAQRGRERGARELAAAEVQAEGEHV